MKKILLAVFIVAFVQVSSAAFAETIYPVEKLYNGSKEIVKAPIHYYDNSVNEWEKNDNKILGLFSGLITSPFHVVKKVGNGAVEVATFLVK